MNNQTTLERAKNLLFGVPPGPWRNKCPDIYSKKKDKNDPKDRFYRGSKVARVPEVFMNRWEREKIAQFISESRTLVPELIEAHDQLLADARELQKALDQSNRQWRMYAENGCYDSVEQSFKEDPENIELETLLKCEKSLETFTKKYGSAE